MLFKQDETVAFLMELLSINSPTGYTTKATHFLQETIEELGYETSTTPKGNLMVEIEGQDTTT